MSVDYWAVGSGDYLLRRQQPVGRGCLTGMRREGFDSWRRGGCARWHLEPQGWVCVESKSTWAACTYRAGVCTRLISSNREMLLSQH
jgi:hypothetical protein